MLIFVKIDVLWDDIVCLTSYEGEFLRNNSKS